VTAATAATAATEEEKAVEEKDKVVVARAVAGHAAPHRIPGKPRLRQRGR
jgi:hypothetical protein